MSSKIESAKNTSSGAIKDERKNIFWFGSYVAGKAIGSAKYLAKRTIATARYIKNKTLSIGSSCIDFARTLASTITSTVGDAVEFAVATTAFVAVFTMDTIKSISSFFSNLFGFGSNATSAKLASDVSLESEKEDNAAEVASYSSQQTNNSKQDLDESFDVDVDGNDVSEGSELMLEVSKTDEDMYVDVGGVKDGKTLRENSGHQVVRQSSGSVVTSVEGITSADKLAVNNNGVEANGSSVAGDNPSLSHPSEKAPKRRFSQSSQGSASQGSQDSRASSYFPSNSSARVVARKSSQSSQGSQANNDAKDTSSATRLENN